MSRIEINGYFGTKESMWVRSPDPFIEGQCFRLCAGGMDFCSTEGVEICNIEGEEVYGVALFSLSDIRLNLPSASKCTILHGHAKFLISHRDEVASNTFNKATCAYEYDNTFKLNGLLFVSANGKLSSTPFEYPDLPNYYRPVGKCTRVPTLDNQYTLGVLFFG